jgi:hypothetical protein
MRAIPLLALASALSSRCRSRTAGSLPRAAAAAIRLRTGRGGARFSLVLLVLAVVEIVLAVGVVDLVVRIALLLGAACGLVAAVLMYLPPSNHLFAARRP